MFEVLAKKHERNFRYSDTLDEMPKGNKEFGTSSNTGYEAERNNFFVIFWQ